jgi:hypothetical protein
LDSDDETGDAAFFAREAEIRQKMDLFGGVLPTKPKEPTEVPLIVSKPSEKLKKLAQTPKKTSTNAKPLLTESNEESDNETIVENIDLNENKAKDTTNHKSKRSRIIESSDDDS